MNFSDQLKTLRAACGKSQKDAAAAIGVTQSSFEKWESGDRTPKAITQEAVISKLTALSKSPLP